ncbi:MAG: hypothetical protein L7S44_06150 [Flavobacteriaceae bacterium]|nr:hypothetical protein [Flavobacteriaceae bacterium]
MKKLILLLLFIPLVSCDSTEGKENIYSFGEDTWIEVYFDDEKKEFLNIDLNDDSDLDYTSFFEIVNNEVIGGAYTYSYRSKKLTKEYYDYGETEGYFFENEKMDVLISRYDEWKDNPKEVQRFLLELKAKDVFEHKEYYSRLNSRIRKIHQTEVVENPLIDELSSKIEDIYIELM